MIVYPIGSSGQRLVISTPVLDHFLRHRQLRWWQREAGGQLFARFALPEIIIEAASGPRRSDWRTRYSYRPNRRTEQREIADYHKRRLHFVGDWHTHPENVPVPSPQDAQSTRELVVQSEHKLNGFVLAIVGREAFPRGLSVSLFNGEQGVLLVPSAIQSASPRPVTRSGRPSDIRACQ